MRVEDRCASCHKPLVPDSAIVEIGPFRYCGSCIRFTTYSPELKEDNGSSN